MRQMTGMLVIVGIVAGLTGVVLSATEDEAAESEDVVSRLEARITALEERLEKLERRPPLVMTAPQAALYPSHPGAVPLSTLPPNWQRREINGMPYYLVPLDSEVNPTDNTP